MKTLSRLIPLCALLACALNLSAASLLSGAQQALDKGTAFYRSIAIAGGYPDRYSADLSRIGDTWALAGKAPQNTRAANLPMVRACVATD